MAGRAGRNGEPTMTALTTRLRSAAEAARRRGFAAAIHALVLGPELYRVVETFELVEPLLGPPVDSTGLPPLERQFLACSDIYAHLPTLYKTTVDRKLRRILELGTRTGESTVALLTAAREVGGRVTSVDIEPCPAAEARVREAGLDRYWTFLRSDDLALEWTEPVDHLFVDTSHTYDHTVRELRKYEPFVAPGGVISMHDTTSHPDVWRAIEDHFRGRKDVRVFRYYHNNGLAVIERHGAPAKE
jgi:predicted O-methyltransferase YrrM